MRVRRKIFLRRRGLRRPNPAGVKRCPAEEKGYIRVHVDVGCTLLDRVQSDSQLYTNSCRRGCEVTLRKRSPVGTGPYRPVWRGCPAMTGAVRPAPCWNEENFIGDGCRSRPLLEERGCFVAMAAPVPVLLDVSKLPVFRAFFPLSLSIFFAGPAVPPDPFPAKEYTN